MSKALVVIKSMGIGDLSILISNIHAISKKIAKPVTVLAQKNTRAHAILKHDPFVNEVIEMDENEIKGFFKTYFTDLNSTFYRKILVLDRNHKKLLHEYISKPLSCLPLK